MGKYLQDVMFRIHRNDRGQTFSERQKDALKSCSLIDELFNLYLPLKIEIGNNIWRLIVYLTLDKTLDGTTEVIGLCQTCYVYYDYNELIPLEKLERKKILLELFTKGLEQCCNVHNYSSEPLKKIQKKIVADGIVFNDYYKDKKLSPDKNHYAQMKGYLSEDTKQLFLIVFDRDETNVSSILVGDYHFKAFDRLKWVDNSRVNVYHINNIQSYKRKKVAEDYFTVDIKTDAVTCNPVTRESIFEYGVKLLTETIDDEKAIKFIKQAKELGHGKADNILRNLAINPKQRDKTILLQTPKRR